MTLLDSAEVHVECVGRFCGYRWRLAFLSEFCPCLYGLREFASARLQPPLYFHKRRAHRADSRWSSRNFHRHLSSSIAQSFYHNEPPRECRFHSRFDASQALNQNRLDV
uniref:Uncharacterized protein n=1 Tax=uncultured marine microorganism HF4000_ANIW137P11 TaxID=455534 RepID=B3T542_9ZZZZ|nr:hypothetical protein ALOHA_HF4000ANIW137P11ctg1g13 [uncultured marine microorganism HF4000_ANIW137P11]